MPEIPDPALLGGDQYAALHAAIADAPGDGEALELALAEVFGPGQGGRRAEAVLALLDASGWLFQKEQDPEVAPDPSERHEGIELAVRFASSIPIDPDALVPLADELARYLASGAIPDQPTLVLDQEARDAAYLDLHATRERLCLLTVHPGDEASIRRSVQAIDRLGSTLSLPGAWSKDNRSHEEPF